MGNLAKRLARKLKSLRGEISQLQYCRKLGLSKSTLNRLEMGQQNVTLQTLEKLCERLKCDVGDLFDAEPKDQNVHAPAARGRSTLGR